MAWQLREEQEQYEVATGEGDALRVLRTATSKVGADAMAGRYVGARVRPKPAPVPKAARSIQPAGSPYEESKRAARTLGRPPAARVTGASGAAGRGAASPPPRTSPRPA
jgi:hypothetical protein